MVGEGRGGGGGGKSPFSGGIGGIGGGSVMMSSPWSVCISFPE